MSDITTEQMKTYVDHSDICYPCGLTAQQGDDCRKAIRSRLTEFDALKAEVERLEKEKQIVMDDAITVAEYWKSKVEKAEAELELARPLLDEMDSILGQLAAEGKEWPIFRAKLRAYRAAKERK